VSTGTTEGAATTGGGAAAARQLGLLSVEAARDAVLAAAEPVGTERVPVGDTLGRVIAEAAIAGVSLPPWPNSAMDGYAIVAADTAAASDEEPVRLEIIGDIRAGANRTSSSATERARASQRERRSPLAPTRSSRSKGPRRLTRRVPQDRVDVTRRDRSRPRASFTR
jgi:hypothetical protein